MSMRRRVILVVALLMAVGTGTIARADGSAASDARLPDRLAAIGECMTDEYFEEIYDYARNWSVLLVDERGLTFGPTAAEAGQPGETWGEPRRTGYEDNWARYASGTIQAINQGQHTGVADGVVNRGVSHFVMFIGMGDFSGGAYEQIYNGNWPQAQIDSFISAVVARLEVMLDVIQPTGVAVVALGIPEYGISPAMHQIYPDPARREAASAAFEQCDAAIRDMIDRRAEQVSVFLEFYALNRAIFGSNILPRETLLVGNVAIDLDALDVLGGGNPTAAFVHDGVHPNTVIQAIWANAIITALNVGHGTEIAPLTEEEMLAAAGIPYGGSDTLEQQIGPLEAFVKVFPFRDGFESGDTSAWSSTLP
jgi:hypothetical protein